MKLAHKTLLIICTIFSLHSMEQKERTLINNSTNIELHQLIFHRINDLYKYTYNILDNYNPTDTHSIAALSEIIKKTKELKNHNINIDEKRIGQFAYEQEEPIKNTFLFAGNPPYNGPFYVSVFFERIARYNAHLQKNEFTSPTPQQFAAYKNNKKIINAIPQAATFGLFIDLPTINKEKKVLADWDPKVAIYDFEKLINDISVIRQQSPEEIKTIANILYGFNMQ